MPVFPFILRARDAAGHLCLVRNFMILKVPRRVLHASRMCYMNAKVLNYPAIRPIVYKTTVIVYARMPVREAR